MNSISTRPWLLPYLSKDTEGGWNGYGFFKKKQVLDERYDMNGNGSDGTDNGYMKYGIDFLLKRMNFYMGEEINLSAYMDSIHERMQQV